MTGIKICGITNLEDASFAVECGADALGFNFYSMSPRHVAPESAREIIEKIPDGITKVGVFVNHDALEVREIVEYCGLDLVQLHGDESSEYCRQFPSSLLIKAFSPREEGDLRKLRSYPVRAILVDAYDPLRYGGTGKRSDWRLAAKVKETHLLIIAGGLNADNIGEAIEIVSPHGVDINSGAESSPGRKDPQKVRKITEIVRRIGGKGSKVFRL
jgi:phosphoribosylanthranilate isomerase